MVSLSDSFGLSAEEGAGATFVSVPASFSAGDCAPIPTGITATPLSRRTDAGASNAVSTRLPDNTATASRPSTPCAEVRIASQSAGRVAEIPSRVRTKSTAFALSSGRLYVILSTAAPLATMRVKSAALPSDSESISFMTAAF